MQVGFLWLQNLDKTSVSHNAKKSKMAAIGEDWKDNNVDSAGNKTEQENEIPQFTKKYIETKIRTHWSPMNL